MVAAHNLQLRAAHLEGIAHHVVLGRTLAHLAVEIVAARSAAVNATKGHIQTFMSLISQGQHGVRTSKGIFQEAAPRFATSS